MERAAEGTLIQRDFRVAKPRVLFVPGFVVDVYSEIERQYVELTKGNVGIEFIWLVPDINGLCNNFAKRESRTKLTEPVWVRHLRDNNIPYVIGNVAKYNVFANVRLFRDIFREHRIDAVYTHFGFERFWATLIGKLFGRVTLWNEHWHSLGTRYTFPKRVFYRLCVDHFIAVSQFIARTLPAKSRVHVVRNAIDADVGSSQQDRQRRRSQLNLPQDRKVVLLVSAFRENKYHDLALAVCSRVVAELSDTVFVFLGDGPRRQWVASEIERLHLTSSVLLPGHVDNVDEYYQAADLCMLTSIGEPCALAIFESMKHGRPLVAFDSGGTPEIIRDGETGMLIPEFDIDRFHKAIAELLKNDEKRLQLGNNARAAALKDADRDEWRVSLRTLVQLIVAQEQTRPRICE